MFSYEELINSARAIRRGDPGWEEVPVGENIQVIELKLVGDSDLLCHRWDPQQVLDMKESM